jgi:hypothetical protein
MSTCPSCLPNSSRPTCCRRPAAAGFGRRRRRYRVRLGYPKVEGELTDTALALPEYGGKACTFRDRREASTQPSPPRWLDAAGAQPKSMRGDWRRRAHNVTFLAPLARGSCECYRAIVVAIVTDCPKRPSRRTWPKARWLSPDASHLSLQRCAWCCPGFSWLTNFSSRLARLTEPTASCLVWGSVLYGPSS